MILLYFPINLQDTHKTVNNNTTQGQEQVAKSAVGKTKLCQMSKSKFT